MKIPSAFLFFILLNNLSLFAQQRLPDYIILKEGKGDTIWCKITAIHDNKIQYKINTYDWVKDEKDIRSFQWNSKDAEGGTTTETEKFNATTQYSKKPKISLCVYEGTTTVTYTNTGTKTSYTQRISHFYLNDNKRNLIELGKRDANLIPYIQDDKEAMKYFKRNRTSGAIQTAGWLISVGSLATLAYGAVSEDDETTLLGGVIFVPSFILTYFFQELEKHQFKKAVEIYNRNAGYGYVSGLEKK